jgi:hypothetical protein
MPLKDTAARPGSRSRIAATAIGAAIAGFMLAQSAPAEAQNAQNPPKQVPTAPDSTRPGVPLSDQLSESKGVIRPPGNVDPEIQTPAPDPNPNTTPVIPPPGTPGGDQNVQPK